MQEKKITVAGTVLADNVKIIDFYPDAGRVGNDESGKFIADTLLSHGVNTDNIIITEEADTSFTDVMTVGSTGERTFFRRAEPTRCFLRRIFPPTRSIAEFFI